MISESRLRRKIPNFEDWKKAQKVLEHKQRQASWVPKGIHDENAIFSHKAPTQKAMRKPGEAAIMSINIFEIGADFKPHCIRNRYSTRNSSLFEEGQSEQQWRSSSKKVPSYLSSSSKPKDPRYCFRSATKTNANQSTIDLSWSQEMGNPSESRMRRSRGEFQEERRLFQGKKRVGHLYNCSSIEL